MSVLSTWGCCVFRASSQTLIVYWLGHLSKQNETIAMYARYYWFPGCVDVQSDAVRNARRLDSSAFSVYCADTQGYCYNPRIPRTASQLIAGQISPPVPDRHAVQNPDRTIPQYHSLYWAQAPSHHMTFALYMHPP